MADEKEEVEKEEEEKEEEEEEVEEEVEKDNKSVRLGRLASRMPPRSRRSDGTINDRPPERRAPLQTYMYFFLLFFFLFSPF